MVNNCKNMHKKEEAREKLQKNSKKTIPISDTPRELYPI